MPPANATRVARRASFSTQHEAKLGFSLLAASLPQFAFIYRSGLARLSRETRSPRARALKLRIYQSVVARTRHPASALQANHLHDQLKNTLHGRELSPLAVGDAKVILDRPGGSDRACYLGPPRDVTAGVLPARVSYDRNLPCGPTVIVEPQFTPLPFTQQLNAGLALQSVDGPIVR